MVPSENILVTTIQSLEQIFFPEDRILFFPPYLAAAIVFIPFTTWLAFRFANCWPPIPAREKELQRMNRADYSDMVRNNLLMWIANSVTTGISINILYYNNFGDIYCHGNIESSPAMFMCRTFLEVLLLILNYDLWTYLFHRACHTNKFLYRWLHAQHHENSFPNNFWMSIYGDYLEGNTIACFAMSGLFLFRVWLGSALIFLFYITFFVAVNHSGRAVTIPYFYSAYYHHIHHREQKYNFTEHLPLWDFIFGTLKW